MDMMNQIMEVEALEELETAANKVVSYYYYLYPEIIVATFEAL